MYYFYKDMSLRELIFDINNLNAYYEKYNGNPNKIINWSKYRIYSIFDIDNSPMKGILEGIMKKQNSPSTDNINNLESPDLQSSEHNNISQNPNKSNQSINY